MLRRSSSVQEACPRPGPSAPHCNPEAVPLPAIQTVGGYGSINSLEARQVHAAEYPKLVLEEGVLTGRRQEISLTGQEVIVGRDPDVDVVIASPLISRRHTRFFADNGQYLVEDLGSTNLTYLNGQRLVRPTVLSGGDTVQLGQAVRLQFVAPAAVDVTQQELLEQTAMELTPRSDETMLASEESLPGLAQPPILVIASGGGPPQTVRLEGELLRLGRATDNDVVIASPIVSGHHALLQRVPAGYLLRVESGAKNPIYYNGQPVE
ncbi:MAG: FHA domain-containing protein, partial [Chloroflexi bacterium]